MTDYENIFPQEHVMERFEFGNTESLYGNSNTLHDNLSDYVPETESHQVRMFSDASNDENESINAVAKPNPHTKSSVTRVKEVYKESNSHGVLRKKVNGTPTRADESTSEKSDRRIASETYKKVKEVEYRREVIYDKNGMVIEYDEDPNEYKKARKRIQNRESAIRSRNRKKKYFTEVEVKFEELQEENKRLSTENATLKAEKKLLIDQLEYFKGLIGNMNSNFSSKGSTLSYPKDSVSHVSSFDQNDDILADDQFDVKEGELPIIGNYKRPTAKILIDTESNERLILTRRDDNSVSGTAGLFFLAIVM